MRKKKKTRLLKRTLQRRLMLIAVFVSFVAAFSSITLYYFTYTSALPDAVKRKTDLVTDRLSRTLAVPLWHLSEEGCRHIVESELSDEDLDAILLQDEKEFMTVGRERPRLSETGRKLRLEAIDGGSIERLRKAALYTAIRSVDYEGNRIGFVTVFAGGRGEYRILRASLMNQVAIALVIGIVVALTLFFAVDRLVSRRIVALAGSVDSFAARDYAVRAEADRKDEIGCLAATFNEMAETIERRFAEKKILIQEIHHRVNNNLQVLKSLISLAESDGRLSSETILELTRKRISAMAVVHAGVFTSESEETVDFSVCIDTLVVEMADIPETGPARTAPITTVRSFVIPLTKAVPCALLVGELLGLANRAAKKGSSDDLVSLLLDGTGKEDFLISLKSRKPLLDLETEPFERLLIEAFAAQLEGSVESKVYPNGAETLIRFKKTGGRKP